MRLRADLSEHLVLDSWHMLVRTSELSILSCYDGYIKVPDICDDVKNVYDNGDLFVRIHSSSYMTFTSSRSRTVRTFDRGTS
jgi:hypothetical protein